MDDLFSPVLENGGHRPLADRMRPRTLDEFVGQEHILGPGRLLRRAIETDRLGSIILYGPPGSGKTTLAHIISRATASGFHTVSAVSSGVKELRRIMEDAANNLKYHGKKTILFVDECHAFNKSQQDVLLPAIEKGIVTFIGGKTENPYFEMRGALLSRSRIFQLEELEIAQESIQRRAVRYDQSGDQHYDVISAFIKSIRGSDPDAALHWYARMTYAGEDQRFIVRRLIILASEDIGLADPRAMLVAHAAWNALETVGMPEARIPIAQCIVHLALAPKSNSVYKAIESALADVQKLPPGPVPKHLRDTHYPGAEKLGHIGYLYPHDYPGHHVPQQYLPDNLKGRRYYRPSGPDLEKTKI